MNTTKLSNKIPTLSLALFLGASAAFAADEIYTAPSFFDGETGAYYGPDCDNTNYSGAYYTGKYVSPFTTVLGKTEEDIQKKLDQLWNHYFKGDDNSKVFYDQGNDGGYIMDTGNNDIRSEGMSYGMMISVQTNHKETFDKIWKYAKNHMWHKGDEWDGYFSWQIRIGGGGDNKPAPDGELYFMTALLFAANRWNDSQYMDDAQYILNRMWNNPQYKLFNTGNYIVTFQPTPGNTDFSDPSYDLPAFVELFSRWSKTDQDKWQKAVTATRDHLYKSSHSTTGLFTDYNNFDGTPHSGFDSNNPSDTYMFDAIRCAMNFGMDYYLFGADAKRETEMAKKILDFFHKDNYSHAHFQWDGSLVNNHQNDPYTLGQKGANAVATYAVLDDPSYEEKIKKNLSLAWDGEPLTGPQRYYDGLVHFLAMLHLTGHFKIWKPMPEVEKKTVEGEYNGETFDKDTTFNAFEGCKLYELTVKPASKPAQQDTTAKETTDVQDTTAQTPATTDTTTQNPPAPTDTTALDTTSIALAAIKAVGAAKVWANNGAIFIENAAIGSKYTVTDMNGRVLKSARISSASQEIQLANKGAMLVIVGNKAYKVMK